jgi:hypothetical protein
MRLMSASGRLRIVTTLGLLWSCRDALFPKDIGEQ